MMDLNKISDSLQSGKAMETSGLITQAIREQCSIESILKQGLVAGMAAVKKSYRKNEIFFPEVLRAARAMNMGIKTIKPFLKTSADAVKETVIIGTVKGAVQDIEKCLIAIMMLGRGLRVIDLGVSVSSEQFVNAAIREKARIIACTAAFTSTMSQMKVLVQAAVSAGIRNQVKILISGGPVTERYCQSIGADMYAPDAVSAAEMTAVYCGKQKF